MKIAFVTTKPPALVSGSQVRNYYLLKALADSKAVTSIVVIYGQIDAQASQVGFTHTKVANHVFKLPARKWYRSLFSFLRGKVPYAEHLKSSLDTDALRALLVDCEQVIISEMDGYFLIEKHLTQSSHLKIVFDAHNIDFKRFESDLRLSPALKRITGSLLVPVFRMEELNALQSSDLILTCSKSDKDMYKHLGIDVKITVIPNGVELTKLNNHSNKNTQKYILLFMGLLSYSPNADGINFFLKDAYQAIKIIIPNVELWIAGKNPPTWLKDVAETDNTVKVLGFVDDLKKTISQADLCVCPLRYGSGTRLKILEYMAMGQPVVTTRVGAEGIDVTDGQHLLIADTSQDFIAAINKLYDNPNVSQKLGKNARKLLVEKYQWKTIGNKMITELVRLSP